MHSELRAKVEVGALVVVMGVLCLLRQSIAPSRPRPIDDTSERYVCRSSPQWPGALEISWIFLLVIVAVVLSTATLRFHEARARARR